jgi:tRNA splicing endonuclease
MVKCKPEFEAIIATEDQEFSLGDIKSTAHPGHTMESTTYLLIDKDGKETAISLEILYLLVMWAT